MKVNMVICLPMMFNVLVFEWKYVKVYSTYRVVYKHTLIQGVSKKYNKPIRSYLYLYIYLYVSYNWPNA